MDFLCDTLAFGRTFRILTIVDEHTRECLATEADTSLPGLRVIRVLEQLALTRGLPERSTSTTARSSSLVPCALGAKSIECCCATSNRAGLCRTATESFNGHFVTNASMPTGFSVCRAHEPLSKAGESLQRSPPTQLTPLQNSK